MTSYTSDMWNGMRRHLALLVVAGLAAAVLAADHVAVDDRHATFDEDISAAFWDRAS